MPTRGPTSARDAVRGARRSAVRARASTSRAARASSLEAAARSARYAALARPRATPARASCCSRITGRPGRDAAAAAAARRRTARPRRDAGARGTRAASGGCGRCSTLPRARIDAYVAQPRCAGSTTKAMPTHAIARNALRHDVVPALAAVAPGYPATLARAAAHCRPKPRACSTTSRELDARDAVRRRRRSIARAARALARASRAQPAALVPAPSSGCRRRRARGSRDAAATARAARADARVAARARRRRARRASRPHRRASPAAAPFARAWRRRAAARCCRTARWRSRRARRRHRRAALDATRVTIGVGVARRAAALARPHRARVAEPAAGRRHPAWDRRGAAARLLRRRARRPYRVSASTPRSARRCAGMSTSRAPLATATAARHRAGSASQRGVG